MKSNNELKIFGTGAFFVVILLILFLLALLSSCSTQKRCIEKPYITVQVSEQFTGTNYTFVNLTYTEGLNFFMHDSAQCKAGDTIIIKKIRNKTLFIKQ